jgi:hypothetical protein
MCIIIIYHNVHHGVLDVEVTLGFFFLHFRVGDFVVSFVRNMDC